MLGPPVDPCVAVLAYDLDVVTAVKNLLVAAAPTLLLVDQNQGGSTGDVLLATL